MRPIDYFDAAVSEHGAEVAIRDLDTAITFRDLQQWTIDLAAGLAARIGQDQARPVAILAGNDHRVTIATLAIMRTGHIVVPVHTRSSVEEIESFLRTIRPACVIYATAQQDIVDRVRERLGGRTLWISLDGDTGPDGSLDALRRGPGVALRDWGGVREDSGRPVFFRQTSGSTAAPKLVVDDIGSFNASNRVLRHLIALDGRRPVFLALAPLSHACGVYALSVLSLGGAVVIMREFDDVAVFRMIARHRITHLWLPPTALYLLLDCPEAIGSDLSSLVCLVLGAAAVSPEKLREAVALFGPCVSVNYSQIESGFLTWLDSATVAAAVAGTHPERLRSSGRSTFVGRVAIMDEAGSLLPPGECGEIVVRGASVKNYLSVEDTRLARQHGWHHTGDLGYLDDLGYLYVVGRQRDVIVSGGFKIAAADVERAVLELPQIRECAVIGVPDPVRGEAITAIIEICTGQAVTVEAVLRHCRLRLGVSKAPRAIEVWSELPRTPVGKVDKRRLRELMASRAADSTR